MVRKISDRMEKVALRFLLLFFLLVAATSAFSASGVYVQGTSGQLVPKQSFSEAVSAASGKTVVLTAPVTISDLTVPSDVALEIKKGGLINIPSGKTLTINGPFTAGDYRVFTGSGAVSGLKEAKPEWWGAIGDDSTNNTAAFLSALAAGRHVIITTPGTYLTTGKLYATMDYQKISMYSGVTIKLASSSSINQESIIGAQNKTGVIIEGGIVDGNYLNQSVGAWDGVGLGTCTECAVRNITILNVRHDPTNDCRGIYVLNGSKNKIHNVHIKNSNNNILVQKSHSNQLSDLFLEDNYLSECLSIYGGSSGPADANYNVVNNVICKNANSGINIDRGKYNTVNGFSIDNARTGIEVYMSGNIVSNGSVVLGDRANSASSAGIKYNIGTESVSDILSKTIFSDIIIESNGFWGRGISASPSSDPASQAVFRNITITDTTESMSTAENAVFISNASWLTFENVTVRGWNGNGFVVAASPQSNHLEFINCVADKNQFNGMSIPNGSVNYLYVRGGSYLNNSQQSAGASNGIKIGTGIYSYEIDQNVNIYDNQATKTQVVGLSIAENTGTPYTGATPPAKGFWKTGKFAYRADPAVGAAAFVVCVSHGETSIRVAAAETETTIETVATPMLAGDNIGILLDDGTYHWTTVATVVDGNTITISSGIPAGKSAAIGNGVFTFRWGTTPNLT